MTGEANFRLERIEVGPWPMNCFLVVDQQTGVSAIIDPGADVYRILDAAGGTRPEVIALTHAHLDHTGALEELKDATGARVYLHPADAEAFGVNYDVPLEDGALIRVGNRRIKVLHTPGHTPGSVSFDLGDGRIVVGDALFVGGPGHTQTPEDFDTTMETMKEVIFAWPDESSFFPGHGPEGRIGEERPAFEAFMQKGWDSGLHGDVVWEEGRNG